MASLPALEISGLWKTYRVHAPTATGPGRMRAKVDFHALSDLSLAVPEGAVLGIVGANGAGKSTLLKILSRVTDPTRGRVVLRGRTASILEIGTGFHPELTGIENVFLNGAVNGLSRRDIKARLPAILEFAEIGDLVYEPARTYSSGMYLRLAFAVAAHLDPDILIVDEHLAVGDQEFRERCLGRMQRAVAAGKTVVLASHDAATVGALCTQAVYLHKGKVVMLGPPTEVLDAYHAAAHAGGGVTHVDERVVELVCLTGTHVLERAGRARVTLDLTVAAREPLDELLLDVALNASCGMKPLTVMGSARQAPSVSLRPGERARWHLEAYVPETRPGAYTVDVVARTRGPRTCLAVSGLPVFTVASSMSPEFASQGSQGVQVPEVTVLFQPLPPSPS